MTSPTSEIKSQLRPRARLLRTLGRDLISSEKVALIELVKNSFDADATTVLIRFTGPLTQNEGRVEVWDDGHGMKAETVQNAWLDIATDIKSRRNRSESGRRRVLGEKGIGRFAASRIANEMLLITRRADSDEVRLLIDWSDFDRENAYLDEIEVAWETGPPELFLNTAVSDSSFNDVSGIEDWQYGHGTLVRLEKLSRPWIAPDFEDLRTALSRLVRPSRDAPASHQVNDFQILLDLPPEFENFAGLVDAPDELKSPHYRLTGKVDPKGYATLNYTQLDPSEDKLIGVSLWDVKERTPEAGPFSLDVQVWDRDSGSIAKVAGPARTRDFRRMLDQLAGISVYRDGFRVLPFGEEGDDWLGLDRRRVQNPTMRLSNNQVIGHIFIGADENIQLKDQTNREGLLEGRAYEDLRLMIRGALAQIETNRYAARRPASQESRGNG